MIYVLKYEFSTHVKTRNYIICFVKGKCKKMVPECFFFGTNVRLFCHFF